VSRAAAPVAPSPPPVGAAVPRPVGPGATGATGAPRAAGPALVGGLGTGYYPAVGFPPGTVVAWDGQGWHGPLTMPGYYDGPGGGSVWWNGQAWCPDIVAGRPVPGSHSEDARRSLGALGRWRGGRHAPA
jgi:hypothetical protein